VDERYNLISQNKVFKTQKAQKAAGLISTKLGIRNSNKINPSFFTYKHFNFIFVQNINQSAIE